jgi:cell division protein FtsB
MAGGNQFESFTASNNKDTQGAGPSHKGKERANIGNWGNLDVEDDEAFIANQKAQWAKVTKRWKEVTASISDLADQRDCAIAKLAKEKRKANKAERCYNFASHEC